MFEAREDKGFPEREVEILAFWNKEKIFEKTLDDRKPLFSFYDGPPFATGLPHYGHLLAGTIKDAVPRYKTMKGFTVPRRFGWDCHGLPVENEIEKAFSLSGAPAIESFGVAKFNEECRNIVLRYTEQWKETVSRMGRWVDFSHTYRTMDKSFMESVWWVFAQAYGKGLVYEGFKVMPYSAKLGTPISNFEANLNYKEVDDPSLVVAFSVMSDPKTAFLAWTTTPWTLPSNLALVVRGDLEYVKIKEKETGRQYILAKARLSANFKEGSYEILDTFLGNTLAGQRYIPLFPYFEDKEAFHVLVDDFVGAEDGTGIVHCAPGFGEADFFVALREGIEPVCPIDQNGHFTKEVSDYEGMFVKDADKEIIKRLKSEGRIFHHGQIHHRYPFCWRSDTPLIYKAVRTWFVAVEKIKEKMLKANDQINWVPGHIKYGRFGKWLENARDWAISRNRHWGTPIPVWRSASGKIHVISSIKELEERTGKKINDIHRHFIDDLTFEEEGETYKRIPEIFDCWFESGSMPYAQNHFPFENKEATLDSFPADFIAEGIDQTRCWFYTLTILSVILYDKPAFKNVIVNGIILAEDGQKMSKRLKNYPEPSYIINQYGADAIRLYLLGSPAMSAEDLRFSEKGVEGVLRQVLIPFWNSYHFLSTYARIYKWKPSEKVVFPEAEIDCWILSCLQRLIQEVTAAMDGYFLNVAVAPLVDFIDQLTNWYIRRSRSRFWSEEDTKDRREAFFTLYTVILELSKLTAPFIPFLSDAIYQGVRRDIDPLSVHLTAFPEYNARFRDENLESEMSEVQKVVSSGHSLRKEEKIRVRQPLSKAHIACSDLKILERLKKHTSLIAEELNVKEVVYHEDESAFMMVSIKPNFRVLGKKVGSKMPLAAKVIADLSGSEKAKLFAGKSLEVSLEGEKITLTPEDVAVEKKVLEGISAHSTGGIAVAFDLTLTPELIEEGLAREIINKCNTMRRDQEFDVTDRICMAIEASENVRKAFEKHKAFICHEVLAIDVTFGPNDGEEWDLNGEKAKILVSKV